MSGTNTYYDPLGNAPNMSILSFTPSIIVGLTHIRIYKRVDAADPSQDVLVITEMLPNSVANRYPYYYVLFNAESGANYVVTYLNSSGQEVLTSATRISTEGYYPPIANQAMAVFNTARVTAEQLRRTYFVLETTGENAILLRKNRNGTRCNCWRDHDRKALFDCGECYGTGWVGGYTVFSPFLICLHPAGEKVEITEYGLVVDAQSRAWTCIIPRVADGDCIVRLWGENRDRYEVNNPTRTTKDGIAGIPTVQEFSLKLHEKKHPIYNFPVEDFVDTYVPPTSHFGRQS